MVDVIIGDVNCINLTVSITKILCTIGSGSGSQRMVVFVNGQNTTLALTREGIYLIVCYKLNR